MNCIDNLPARGPQAYPCSCRFLPTAYGRVAENQNCEPRASPALQVNEEGRRTCKTWCRAEHHHTISTGRWCRAAEDLPGIKRSRSISRRGRLDWCIADSRRDLTRSVARRSPKRSVCAIHRASTSNSNMHNVPESPTSRTPVMACRTDVLMRARRGHPGTHWNARAGGAYRRRSCVSASTSGRDGRGNYTCRHRFAYG